MNQSILEQRLAAWGLKIAPSMEVNFPWQTRPINGCWPVDHFRGLDQAWRYWLRESNERLAEVRAAKSLSARANDLPGFQMNEVWQWLSASPLDHPIPDCVINELIKERHGKADPGDLAIFDDLCVEYGPIFTCWLHQALKSEFRS